jgi:hypothetical protein
MLAQREILWGRNILRVSKAEGTELYIVQIIKEELAKEGGGNNYNGKQDL